MKRGHWGTGSNKRMMSVVASVVEKMKVPVTFINITQISEYRIDGHASVYNELGGKLLTEEQRADPSHYADCIHCPAFQRFAVRTSKRIEDISNKAAQTREELAKQLKEASKNFEDFKNQQ
ncbi:hypothetical protein RHGRI_015512 [Rhododendron griersonianum]|uniref:Trichome birefringence-like C-terminal domain-containing protein n=1 Tax=Rhododendron griersonianum TaxID=479676 RepID=A0AAV6KDL4_9ERIC|nr:hypothetical protein RHGRI_015512 [Rhododendron griersonianum]